MPGYYAHLPTLFDIFDDVLSKSGSSPSFTSACGPDAKRSPFEPAVDIYSLPSHYEFHVSLAGGYKPSFSVTFDPQTTTLVVSGEIRYPGDFGEYDSQTLREVQKLGERRVGNFERKIKLSERGDEEGRTVDFEGSTAEYENGILVIKLPKVEKEAARKIEIE